MAPFIYRGIFLNQRNNDDKWRYLVLRACLLLVSAIRPDFHVLNRELVYLAVLFDKPNAPETPSLEDLNGPHPWVDLTGYLRLLSEGIGKAPKLPTEFEIRCRGTIEERHPEFFDRPFVVLLLRRRGKDSNAYETRIRDAGPDENYVSAVRFLTARGYRVVGQGQIDHSKFREIDGYYALDNLDVPAPLLNLFLLTKCRLYVGQHSGAYMLTNSCGNRTCLVDTGTFVDGTFMKDDIVLFKRAYDTLTERWLSPIEIFQNHMDLALTYSLESKGIRLEPNSPEEILGAVRESIDSIESTLTLSPDDKRLCDAFRSIVPPTTLLHYKGNRTSLEVLRRDREFLRDV